METASEYLISAICEYNKQRENVLEFLLAFKNVKLIFWMFRFAFTLDQANSVFYLSNIIQTTAVW